MKKYDVTALGECLIDFVVLDAREKVTLEGNAGGAPVNVLAGCARLGLRTAFIGKLSTDRCGKFLLDSLVSAGISTDCVVIDDKCPTTLAMVSLDESGDRSFSFYREQTSDVMLRREEIDFDAIAGSEIFHFGSVSLTQEPARSSTLAAARYAHENGITVSFDMNLRERLWKDLGDAHTATMQALELAQIVKLSEEELVFLTGSEDLEQGMKQLHERFGMKLLAVTRGAKGCIALHGGEFFCSRAYEVDCIDTTGSGDSFVASLLCGIVTAGVPVGEISPEGLRMIIDRANAAGSLTASKRGAVPAMPTLEQIEKCVAENKRI